MVGSDRPQMAIWLMRIAYWKTKTTHTTPHTHTNTHTHTQTHTQTRTNFKYVILSAFRRQQLLRASMLRLYIHCLSC
jgi:carbohydrate-binding DOMON domain-containing protein